jgi:hypothetical protein
LLPQNSAVAVPLNTVDVARDVTINLDENGDPTRITVAVSGVFNIAFSSQLEKDDSGTDSVSIWLEKNGVTLDWTGTDVFLQGQNDNSRTVAAWNFFVALSAGDHVRLMISASNNLRTTVLADPGTSPSGRPAIPSTILTVNQVGELP